MKCSPLWATFFKTVISGALAYTESPYDKDISRQIHLVPFQLCSDCHLHFGKIPNGFFSRNNLTTNVPFCHLQKFMPLYFCDSYYTIKGNNKITELRTIFQRESQNSQVYKQTKSVNNRKTVKTVMTLTWYRHF